VIVKAPAPASVPPDCVRVPPTLLVPLRTNDPLRVRLLAKTEVPEIVKGPVVNEISALSLRLLIVWLVGEEIAPMVIVTPEKLLLMHTTSVDIGTRPKSQLVVVVH
jgi:hypothetical protein